ncbi:MAG: methionyl-tRNA formyltransferase [Candidatus Binatia bacterium]
MVPLPGTPERFRVVFMGTPDFACTSLAALLAGPDRVVAVVCQPDKPRGRGLAVVAPPVKSLALLAGVRVLQPAKLRDPEFEAVMRSLAPDLIVVAAYGKILPRWLLDLPGHGCVNVHASILPRHRGAAPIQWAILAGDSETGVTIMAMNEEMDAGDILLVRRTPIDPGDTAGTLTERLAILGAEALMDALVEEAAGRRHPIPQPAVGMTFAPRVEREHGRLDWQRSAVELERAVRAFAPVPGAFTTLDGHPLKVHRAAIVPDQNGAPGRVLHAGAAGIVVGTGAGALALLEVQPGGKRRMEARAFLAGHPVSPGTCLGTA